MKLERKRKPHRCSVKPDPYAGWALTPAEWKKAIEEEIARRTLRQG